MWFLKKEEKRVLGIDIGFYSIKVVELTQKGKKLFLTNYGEIVIRDFKKEKFLETTKNAFFLDTKKIIESLSKLFEAAEIREKKVVFSLPDLVTFITCLEVEKEIEGDLRKAVISEARKYLPLPPSQMMIDFSATSIDNVLNILLFAIPKDTIGPYQQIGKSLGLKILGFFPEVFALVNSVVSGKEKNNFLILDIGEKSTTFNITKGPVLQDSRNIEIASFHFTKAIALEFNIPLSRAENLKLKYGISGQDPEGEKVKKAILPLISSILKEIENLLFEKKIDKIFLGGGGANMPGLLEYFKNYFKMEVEIVNPFFDIAFQSELKDILVNLGPSFAISVGLAKKGFELL